MAACSICKTTIPAGDVVAGKYKKRDGQTICLKCDAVSVPRPAAAKPPTQGGAKPATPRPGAPKSPSTASAKPAPRPAAAPRETRAQLRYQPQPAGLDQATKIGLMVAGGVAVAAIVILSIIFMKHSRDDAAQKEVQEASRAAVESVEKMVSENPDNYDAILEKIEQVAKSKKVIESGKDEAMLNKFRSDTLSRKQAFEFRKRNQDAYAQCEMDADNPEKINETVKAVEALAESARGMEDEFIQKVDALSLKIHTNAVQFIESGIKKYSAENPKDLKGILDRYRLGIQKLQDMATQPGETGKFARGKSRELKTAEEDFAMMYYNEVSDRLPWVSLLDQNHISNWFTAGNVELQFENGQMIAKSTDAPGAKARGLILSGKRDYWIDFDAEFEVEVKSFGFDIVGRYSGPQNSFQLPFQAGGENNPIVEGGVYKVFVSAVGREVIQRVERWNAEGNAWEKVDLAVEKYNMPTAARSGAFGFGIMPGGTSVFRSIRARILRVDVN